MVIPVTKFRDDGHLTFCTLERRCGWNVKPVSEFLDLGVETRQG
jgi:hypothetical protein